MTLDQLDDAFQTGLVNENTYLWKKGAADWVTLREAARLDADEEPSQDIASSDDRRKRLGRWLFAAALIAAAGLCALQYHAVALRSDFRPATEATTRPVPRPELVATPVSLVPPGSMAAAPEPDLAKSASDDVKPRHAHTDNSLAGKQAARPRPLQQRPSGPRPSRSRLEGAESVFHEGGEPGDPLDSSL
jgi:hypothetical protein